MSQFDTYRRTLETDLARGNATEHTHRSTLKTLLESLYPGTVATNEPKRIKVGAPDYVIQKGETPLGYIEAKDVGVDLDKVEKSDQMKRYLGSLGNLILTDYLEYRWYVEGDHRRTVKLGTFMLGSVTPEADGEQQLKTLLDAFMEAKVPTLKSPAALAKKMASLAQQIRFSILEAFKAEDLTDDDPDPLNDQYNSFKEVLISDLTPAQFADMYAQTITYGLFAARTSPNFTPPFTRYKAAYDIPKTNPFLQTMFRQMAGPDLPSSLDWIVDDLVNLLDHADIGAILADFGKRTRTEDPVVHFYETFLTAYDPKMREARGVYYTPEPVVSYIVRSVDHILKTDFGLTDGLADTSKLKVTAPERESAKARKTKDVHRVQILDPATGTATFLHSVIDQINQTVTEQYGQGAWSGYVGEHLLPRLYGFELLMAPYTVAHMKLGLQLRELGYDFSSNERLKIYLTNTLEEAQEFPSLPLFGQLIARESQEAGQIKQDAPVMVVLGNPPYSGHSANEGEWIRNLLRGKDTYTKQDTENYFEVDGKPLGERNPKWLNDDYVKFIRFSQWRIEQTGYGILAFVTNHGYLDNPTFRGMRQSLMNTFDDLYLLDLHGNAKKKEKAPDGSVDQNVFDIQQGVAIGLLVKKPTDKAKRNVYRADLYGVRESKYQTLWETDISKTEWSTLKPQGPFYLFSNQDYDLFSEYEKALPITEIMLTNSVGIVTARDALTIQWTEQDTWNTVKDFSTLPTEEARSKYNLGKDARDWKVDLAQKDLNDSGPVKEQLETIFYRPFDIRHTYYTGHSRGFHCMPRAEVMQHMLAGDNLALHTCRQVISDSWQHILVTGDITDDSHVSNKSRERGYLFPLYLYPTEDSTLFDQPTTNPGGRRPNLAPEFIEDVSNRLELTFTDDGKGDLETTFGPEDVFHYIYAVFHAPTYRERYAEFLKIDFPRVPLTSNLELFQELAAKGEALVSYHLMDKRGPNLARFAGEGDGVVDKPKYKQEEGVGRVYINESQYFEGVPEEVWEFYVGGYQVCHKWLKDRKKRVLSFDDIKHYQGIVSALSETIRLMSEVDAVIEEGGGFPLS